MPVWVRLTRQTEQTAAKTPLQSHPRQTCNLHQTKTIITTIPGLHCLQNVTHTIPSRLSGENLILAAWHCDPPCLAPSQSPPPSPTIASRGRPAEPIHQRHVIRSQRLCSRCHATSMRPACRGSDACSAEFDVLQIKTVKVPQKKKTMCLAEPARQIRPRPLLLPTRHDNVGAPVNSGFLRGSMAAHAASHGTFDTAS